MAESALRPVAGAAPRVTALLTSHNYAEYVPDALAGVLEQDYDGEVEIVVVDDGSTDGSRDVLAGYGDRIRVIAQENRGQLLALKEGLAASTGDVICLLDADDAWRPDRVRRVVEAFGDGTAWWVANGLAMCDERLRPTGTEVPPSGRPGPVSGDPVLFLERRAGTATSGLAFRRDLAVALVEAIEGLEGELTGALRYDADRLILALIGTLRRPGRQLAEPLTYYRRHGRQQFAGEARRIAMLERQVEVDLMVAEVMNRELGWSRVPTYVPKHQLILSGLRREGGRWRTLGRGLREAARLLRDAPGLALRQGLALVVAWAAPRWWLERLERRQGGAA